MLCQLIQHLRIIFFRLISNATIRGNPTLNQPLLALGAGEIRTEGKVVIGYFPSPYFFSTYSNIEARNKSAIISIGHGTLINNGFCAIAEHSSITIGDAVLVGTNVEIIDSDFHGIKITDRRISKPEWAKPVSIADSVFIGSNVKILKGVSIGAGAVIANGSVVSTDVPPNSIFGGNPAKLIKMAIN